MLTARVFKTFRRRLTNLSSRNRSLLLTSLPAEQFLDLHEADFLLNKPSFTIIAELIARKSAVAVCDVLDPRQERSNEVSRKLRRIARTARFITEERGTEDLFVGWPFVRGKFLDGSVIHGPLLFFPVQIEQSGKHWRLTRRGDELAFLNPTLALAYGQFNQVKLPDEIVDKTADDFDKDPLVFRTQLYEWLKTTPFEINFNQDLFTDQLRFFDKQNAKSLDQLERTGELKLYSEAVLGIFPQAGSYLVPDYDELIRREGENESVLSFSSLSVPSPLPYLPEKFLHTPLPIDASQEAAIWAVKAGQSLVVQGPPGTGKSQLIANLMADAAAGGKRVLLVCQKRAALDVVQERLSQAGMAPFIALIHDFQDDRKALYAQIAEQIERIDAYRQQNNSLNAVLLERDFEVESRRIDELVQELHAFKQALFDTSVCGLSAKELYLTSKPDEPSFQLDDIYQQFHFTYIDNFIRRLSDYAAYQQRLGPDHVWSNRVSFAQFSTSDLVKISQTVTDVPAYTNQLCKQWEDLFGETLLWSDFIEQNDHHQTLNSVRQAIGNERVWTIVSSYAKGTLAANSEAWFSNQLALLGEINKRGILTKAVNQQDLPALGQRIQDGINARRSLFKWLFYGDKDFLRSLVHEHELTTNLNDLRKLQELFENRMLWEQLVHEIVNKFTSQPVLLTNPIQTQAALTQLQQDLREATSIWTKLTVHFSSLAKWIATVTGIGTVRQGVQQAESWLIDAVERNKFWQTYLTKEQTNQLAHSTSSLADQLIQILRRDFDLLVEADRLQESFTPGERITVNRLNQTQPVQWVAVFQNSLRLAWLAHLEQRHPELRSVSSLKMEQNERTLQESLQRKQSLSRNILLVKLREQTYRNLTFNRLNNVVSYRELLHQTTKKRNIWPVRKLMEQFADEVFKLVPCWMASPESVSAIFPLRNALFDLVIFDEASQCFAESGIPAMYRGKQLVITGDTQQLRPSDLYRVQINETPDDETPVALEVESLLELTAQQLPQVSLKEHYRSRSLDLITFSNQHFYQNKLSLLPHFDDLNRHEPAIHYLNVKGVWENNINQVEAEAVLKLLDEVKTELPGRSIGIVTFNYPQQQLIQEMLESRVGENPPLLSANGGLSPTLLVKNIENVQGDERDIIIFSVGYAPDQRGRLLMQFGSLNARGGENRLNVAVTRARERVYVVTSLWPDQLNVSGAVNEGPKLLKAYLTYALDVAQGRFRPQSRPNQVLTTGSLLKDKLSKKYTNWQPNLPFADLAVQSSNAYASLILTDDDLYYEQTPKESHAYVPFALQTKGWPFRRYWSREHWRITQQ